MIALWKPALASGLTFLILDYIWLGYVARGFYLEHLASIGRIRDGRFVPVPWSALLVYVVLVAGTLGLVLPRVDPADAHWRAALFGALFGLCTYGVYNFTNHAVLKDYPALVAFADVTWGIFVCAAAAYAAAWARAF